MACADFQTQLEKDSTGPPQSAWSARPFPTAVDNGLALCSSSEPGGYSGDVFPAGWGLGTGSNATGMQWGEM